MLAEPSAAGYGCREASEVMTGVVERGGTSVSGEWRSSIGRASVYDSFLSAEPASRKGDLSNRLDKEGGPLC
jgi:hypothetical protein